MSAVADGPRRVGIYGERTSDVKLLRIGPWVRARMLLLDLGFYDFRLFTKIHENGGYFVSRLKKNANPLIVSSNRTCPGNSIDVVGKGLQDVLPRLKRQVLDVMVEVEFLRRKYRGKRRKDRSTFRLVAEYNDEAGKYHLYLTNIGTEQLDAEDIACLYGARWEVELIIKELKSRYAMDKVNTTNPQIVKAYIWTALLTMFASRVIHSIVRRMAAADGKAIVRYTRLRWSRLFCEEARTYLTWVLAYYGFEISIETLMGVYNSQALDPHVNRERLTEKWWH